MKPIPSQVISGIRTILNDTIAPELTSDHARSRLVEIRAVLAQIDWDNAGFTLAARSVTLAAALSQAQPWLSGNLPTAPTEDSFAAYQDYFEKLSATATETLAALRTAKEQGDVHAGRVYLELLAAV